MIELFEVHATGPDGAPTLARTALYLDGSVIMRVRAELLDDTDALAQHLAAVGERLEQQVRRLRWIDRALFAARRGAEVLAVITAAKCAWEVVQGDLGEALAWAAWTAGSLLLRWLVPRIVVRLGRWWLQRTLRRIREQEQA